MAFPQIVLFGSAFEHWILNEGQKVQRISNFRYYWHQHSGRTSRFLTPPILNCCCKHLVSPVFAFWALEVPVEARVFGGCGAFVRRKKCFLLHSGVVELVVFVVDELGHLVACCIVFCVVVGFVVACSSSCFHKCFMSWNIMCDFRSENGKSDWLKRRERKEPLTHNAQCAVSLNFKRV